MKIKFDLNSAILLFIGAIIWGFAFVFQARGMNHIGPFTFTALRSIIAFLFSLIVVVMLPSLSKTQREKTKENYLSNIAAVRGGIYAGIVIFIGMSFQQVGIIYTSAGKAGFITALYIVMVPILGLIFNKKILPIKVWLCLLISIIGFYLISIRGKVHISKGDLYVFIGSLFYAVHILILSHFSPRTDGIKLNGMQFLVAGILSLSVAVFKEKIDIKSIYEAGLDILFVGILSSGVAYTLQIIGLKKMDPTLATMISSTESIFAVVGGVWILKETLTSTEFIGCFLVFFATIFAQLPEGFLKKNKISKSAD
ncbi:putative membrane protein [Clostridiales bacterium KA00134]|nr:putative membrane protein [Clostridiales bacterium KA00134]